MSLGSHTKQRKILIRKKMRVLVNGKPGIVKKVEEGRVKIKLDEIDEMISLKSDCKEIVTESSGHEVGIPVQLELFVNQAFEKQE